MFQAIPSDCKKESSFLGLREGFDSAPVHIPAPVFHFEKDGDPILFRYDIDLSSFRCDKIRFDDFVSMVLKISYSKEFCLVACGF